MTPTPKEITRELNFGGQNKKQKRQKKEQEREREREREREKRAANARRRVRSSKEERAGRQCFFSH